MRKYLKPMIIGAFLFALVFAGFNVPVAKALTVQELQAQIQALMQQITALQQQLAQAQGNQGVAWCHTFSKNLRIGDSGQDVNQLAYILKLQNLLSSSFTDGDQFDEQIASTVVEFQEKYGSEILTPSGLKHGTGFVGASTKAKLNKLYGCLNKPEKKPEIKPELTCQNLWWYDNDHKACAQKQFCGAYMYLGLKTFTSESACKSDLNPAAIQPSITVTSPNGGERWEIGSSQKITWTTIDIPVSNNMTIRLRDSVGVEHYFYGSSEISNTIPNYGYFFIIVPSTLVPGQYKIEIKTSVSGQSYLDVSNSYFSITAPATACTDSDNGLDYFTASNVRAGEEILYDKCMGWELWEYSCENGQKKTNYYVCPNGCLNGVCKQAIGLEDIQKQLGSISGVIADLLKKLGH